jgi:hypothetical protein
MMDSRARPGRPVPYPSPPSDPFDDASRPRSTASATDIVWAETVASPTGAGVGGAPDGPDVVAPPLVDAWPGLETFRSTLCTDAVVALVDTGDVPPPPEDDGAPTPALPSEPADALCAADVATVCALTVGPPAPFPWALAGSLGPWPPDPPAPLPCVLAASLGPWLPAPAPLPWLLAASLGP